MRFEIEDDDDAHRLAAVAGVLGFAPVRLVATEDHRDRWALSELRRRYSLSPSEHDMAAHLLGIRPCGDNRHVKQRLEAKLAGKTVQQAVAEIAEVRS
jgi:hypothetical protein